MKELLWIVCALGFVVGQKCPFVNPHFGKIACVLNSYGIPVSPVCESAWKLSSCLGKAGLGGHVLLGHVGLDPSGLGRI